MKKSVYILLAAGMVLAACTKDGPALMRGSYSFKTGGSLELTGKLYETKLDTVKIDTVVRTITIIGIPIRDTSYNYVTKTDTVSVRDTVVGRRLVTESGQMHILEKSGGEMVLTMNITGGDPVVVQASAKGSTITLDKTKRFVPVHDAGGVMFSYHDLEFSGTGTRYDNMIVFDLVYEGSYKEDGFEGEITASRINCIATENE